MLFIIITNQCFISFSGKWIINHRHRRRVSSSFLTLKSLLHYGFGCTTNPRARRSTICEESLRHPWILYNTSDKFPRKVVANLSQQDDYQIILFRRLSTSISPEFDAEDSYVLQVYDSFPDITRFCYYDRKQIPTFNESQCTNFRYIPDLYHVIIFLSKISFAGIFSLRYIFSHITCVWKSFPIFYFYILFL